MITLLRIAALAAVLFSGTPAAQQENLQTAIERAQHLSVTESLPASQPVIDALMNRLEAATPRQRVEIQLLDIRNVALRGDYERAIERLKGLLGSISDPEQRLRALGLAANLGINSQRYEWGYAQLKSALELLPVSDDAVEQSNILSLAGFTHSMIGDHDRAVDYASQALAIAEQAESVAQRCRAGQRLAVAYRYAERMEAAGRIARQAIQTCGEVDNQVYLGTVELEMAYVALSNDDVAAAESWAEQGLERLRTAGWADGVVTGEMLLAEVASARGLHSEAVARARAVIDRIRDRALWKRKIRLHRLIATSLADMGDYAEAYRSMEDHTRAQQRFLDEDRARRLAILEVEFNVERTEQEVELLKEQQRVAELEAQARRQEARLRWLIAGFVAFLFLILVLLLVHVLRDRRHFRRLSQLDGLTLLSNHTRFFDTARLMIEESHRAGRPLVLVIGDIDHFKAVNDEFGHIAGDQALRRVARVLNDGFPDIGQVGRIGGEEFAVCIPDASLDDVLADLENVRRGLSKIDYGGNGKPLTMSFGVAALERDEPLEMLRRRADEALYRAKNGGRNSIVVAKDRSIDKR